MEILGVIGSSKSGKTSTVEYLISKLTERGFKVGSAKHVHHPDFTIDVEGKDTWRHTAAGAKRVVCVSEDEVAVIRREKGHNYTLEDILRLFQDGEFDLIVLEGFHKIITGRSDVVKIVVGKDEADVERVLKGTSPPIIAVTGIVSSGGASAIHGIPVINVQKDGEGVRLANMVTEHLRRTADASL